MHYPLNLIISELFILIVTSQSRLFALFLSSTYWYNCDKHSFLPIVYNQSSELDLILTSGEIWPSLDWMDSETVKKLGLLESWPSSRRLYLVLGRLARSPSSRLASQ